MASAASPALPALPEFSAGPAWRSVDFISDLHLSAEQPATTELWADYLETSPADAIFILGDLFEVWIGDDACREGRFEQQAAAVLAAAASRRTIGFMAGNRDFLVGVDLLEGAGLVALADPTVLLAWGRRIVLTHGDELCVADEPYQAFRRQVRSEQWRAEFLARPLPERERMARQMRDASEAAKRRQTPGHWVDVDATAAVSWLRAADSVEMVHGHTHRPASQALAPGLVRHVLSDWDVDGKPGRAQVLRLTRDGFTRIDLVS